MQAVTTIGLDIAKSIFQVHAVDAKGNVVVRHKLKRRYVVAASVRRSDQSECSAVEAYWPARVVPPKGAPNVLLIMTDDVGFGAPSTFGGVIPTPSLDRVANMGLRYTQFHSTALCSPTRARAQPSLRGLRSDLRNVYRLPRL